jgi:hypothetical protein
LPSPSSPYSEWRVHMDMTTNSVTSALLFPSLLQWCKNVHVTCPLCVFIVSPWIHQFLHA